MNSWLPAGTVTPRIAAGRASSSKSLVTVADYTSLLSNSVLNSPVAIRVSRTPALLT